MNESCILVTPYTVSDTCPHRIVSVQTEYQDVCLESVYTIGPYIHMLSYQLRQHLHIFVDSKRLCPLIAGPGNPQSCEHVKYQGATTTK